MSGPLLDAVEAYLARGLSRFHMPGHKGVASPPFGDILRYDVTEIPGTDSLYEASGPIAETEAAFARLYGAAGSFLSAGGSTLCIQAMLALAAPTGGRVLAARGVHTAALAAMALLDIDPVWLFPPSDPLTALSSPVTAGEVRAALAANPGVKAVYITSPTYYGVLSDVRAIAAVCHRHGVPLLVDNAHGAHLRFLPGSPHPIAQGADLCCDSLHKTLPVLTGGALLHAGNPAFIPDAKRRMSLFGSTSPSYLILLSAGGVLPYLEGGAAADLARVGAEIAALKILAKDRGFLLPPGCCDPIRLTLGFAPLGFDAGGFRAHLARHKLEPELCDSNGGYAVFIAGGGNTDGDFRRLRDAIAALPPAPAPRPGAPQPFIIPERALPLREAVFAPSGSVPVERAAGRIAASPVSVCPPGIPLAVPGERIHENMLAAIKKYGIPSLNVVL